ncbi:tail length tape measure protein [Klebsiella pneumoniae]|nr:tail length tape measure protein [Klebsiella pneumoniae]
MIYSVISVVGRFPKTCIKSKRKRFKTALAERLDIQEEYYKKTDEQQSDWRAGISDSLMNYANQASDLSSMACHCNQRASGCHH